MKKSVSESLRMTVAIIQVVSIFAAIVLTAINIFFFEGKNQTLDHMSIIGLIVFIVPVFILQFSIPAGLADFWKEIPVWGKIAYYFALFPFANMWMLAATDAAFHFLPNFHEAMAQGASRLIVQAMREQATAQAWIIMGATYFIMLAAGLLYREARSIFKNKFKAKIA